MLSCVPFAVYYDDQNHINTFLLCSLITISFGFLLRFLTKDEKNAWDKEGNLKALMIYENGKRVGSWKIWDENGQLAQIISY